MLVLLTIYIQEWWSIMKTEETERHTQVDIIVIT